MQKALKKLARKLKTKRFKNNLQKKASPWIYFIFGITLLLLGTTHFIKLGILSFANPPEAVNIQERKLAPVRIEIPSLKIDLPIEESSIEDGQWQVSYTGASHLDISARPGEGNNIVIYGHNKKIILGSLPWIKIGEKVVLTNESGEKFNYQIVSKETVNPDKVDLLVPGGHEELTIYTCTGFLDSKRLVVKAKPV